MTQESNSLAIRFDADLLDVALPPIQPQPLLQAIRVIEPATLMVDLGPRFATFRAATQQLDTTTRTTIELMPAPDRSAAAGGRPAAAAARGAPPAAPPDLSALGAPVASLRTIAIDPGHGGEDDGVKGAGGTKEKDLTLAVARRVKAAIESRLGIRVLLTRDDDRNVSLDDRAAMANNNKADLFISLHANASFRNTAGGASILYAAFDGRPTWRRVRPVGAEKLPTFGGGLRDIDLVLWDLAQIRHIDRSGELAMILADQFRDRIPLSVRPIDRASLRVLASANMPAVMVEMGYLSNQEQETQMAGAEFQNRAGAGGLRRGHQVPRSAWRRHAVTSRRILLLGAVTVIVAGFAWLLFVTVPACVPALHPAGDGSRRPGRAGCTRTEDQGAPVLRRRRRHAAHGSGARRARSARAPSSRPGRSSRRKSRRRSNRSCRPSRRARSCGRCS